MGVEFSLLGPSEFARFSAEVAELRIEVFRAFPYLYDGDRDYEARYLETYARSADSLWVLAREGERIVGASTCLPLADEDPTFQQPWIENGLVPAKVFYFGESVLLPGWRGQGIGHAFFDFREAHARALGRFDWTAFAAVERSANDPRRPPDHRDNDAFWTKRGYVSQPNMRFQIAWKELGESSESAKTLSYWLRALPRE